LNDLLQLKGNFEQRTRKSSFGSAKLPKGGSVTASKLKDLIDDLETLDSFWKNEKIIPGALVSVYYIKIAAKSNRLKKLFAASSSVMPNDSVVGAKFYTDIDGKKKHVITHHIKKKWIKRSILQLQSVLAILEKHFNGVANESNFNGEKSCSHIPFNAFFVNNKTAFRQLIVDAYYVSHLDIEYPSDLDVQSSLVTLYDVELDLQMVFDKLGIKVYRNQFLNDTTVYLDEQYLEVLLEKAPYLVAMATENLSDLSPDDIREEKTPFQMSIPEPSDEPTIGVIDTLFDERVYFSEWVEYQRWVDEDIPVASKDFNHGTAVTSLIVDGPTLNPELDDGCGRFKVRHFGVAVGGKFNSLTIIRSIKQIIASNRDIKVWNLSLGSNEEIHESFISAEAAALDQIQYENDVIFVVAGTNKGRFENEKRIGPPADSINSLIVNSVDSNKKSAEYSRKGLVLSFFTKPDVSYYGGSRERFMKVCEPLGEFKVAGTSYAAPWIARKLSYLIDIMGLSKEVAKALMIDSAHGWGEEPSFEELTMKGHGIVPVRIEDIVQVPEDEIQFVVTGISEKYDTFNYNFPVPVHKNMHPYVAKATLCYFPNCSRNQGVDYTNTELDIYFGRINDKGQISSINQNKQSPNDELHFLTEEDAREQFKKWDNIKTIKEILTSRTQPRKAYSLNLWGMSIKTKERLEARDGEEIRFGVVVTLKALDGKNRIEDFIQQCSLRGWLVNRINVDNRIMIYEKAEEEVTFD